MLYKVHLQEIKMPKMRTLSLDDIFALETVADAQISPDGSQVAFVVTRSYSEPGFKTPAASVWSVPYDGTDAPRRLTSGNHADNHPRWSPGSQTLAFLSDREKADVFQIYTISLNGGEGTRLTNVKGGVKSFKWSLDGSQLAFTAAEAADEAEEARHKVRDDAEYLDHDYKFTRLWVVDAKPGSEPKALTPAEYQVQDFAWYGSGWAILRGPTPHLNDMRNWDVMTIQENGSSEILARVKYSTFGIEGSADGKSLAWINNGTDAESSANELWVIHHGGAPRCVTQDYAGGMYWAAWLPEGKALLTIAVDSTQTRLGKVSLESGEVETISLSRIPAELNTWQFKVSVSRDEQRMVGVLEDGTHPGDVWAIEPGNDSRQITFFNERLSEIKLGKTETIRWNAPDGLEIEGVLIYPSGYEEGKRYPLIADIHGGPTWYWLNRFMANWHDWGQWLAANGYAVLLPNPRGSAGRGRDFAWTNQRNWGVGDFDDVMSGVDYLIERGIADPDRMGIGGWSYGGYMTSWAIGHTGRFKAAIVGAGVTDLLSFQASDISNWLPEQQFLKTPYEDLEVYLRSSPITYISNVTTPTLILHGASDERVRLGQGRELYNGLRLLKKPVEMVIYPREPHVIGELHHQRDLLTRVARWFNQYLQPDMGE
jgi:dipeptidyl aminopeptidase/acylaminoacyl peptidase